MLGYTPEELYPRPCMTSTRISPRNWQTAAAFESRGNSRTVPASERRDGDPDRHHHQFHEGGEYGAFMRDITDRKRAEAQLHLTQFAMSGGETWCSGGRVGAPRRERGGLERDGLGIWTNCANGRAGYRSPLSDGGMGAPLAGPDRLAAPGNAVSISPVEVYPVEVVPTSWSLGWRSIILATVQGHV